MTISERPRHLVPRYSRQSSFRNYSLEAFSDIAYSIVQLGGIILDKGFFAYRSGTLVL